ncbi:MAG: DUF3108 domain-containing protein [Sphingobacteriales bacterium]|nr:MAG: DUF3108 domain-containing protein [Sphingobacteriales bacterium]
MKIKLSIFLVLINLEVIGQKLPVLKNSAFEVGETLKYKFRYGFFTGAEATLQVLQTDIKFDNHETYRLVAQGRTSGTFDIFFKVRNRYESYIDKNTFEPYLYTEDVNESDYHRTDKARFYPTEKKVIAKKGTFKNTADQVFDLVSAYYFSRNINLNTIDIGDKITLNYFLEDGITPLTIEYVGKEKVKTSMGYFNCRKYSPAIQPGRIFRKGSRFYLWITDDANNIPVKAQAELVVGSVTMELTQADGLKNSLKILSKRGD